MKKFFYTAAIAAVTLSLTACGGKNNDKEENEEQANQSTANTTDFDTTDQTDETGLSTPAPTSDEQTVSTPAEEPVSAPAEEPVSAPVGVTYVTSNEISQYISDGKSGDLDRMISAYSWYAKKRSELKPEVRNLNEDAIKAVAEMEKAEDEVADAIGSTSLKALLYEKFGSMSDSQEKKFKEATDNDVFFFSGSETMSKDSQKYNELYRKYRYGSPF